MRLILIFLIISLKVSASDSLVIYTLPNQIRIEHQWQFVVSKKHSLQSQEIINLNLKNIIPTNVPYKIINDSIYYSARNVEIEELIEGFESNFRIHKIAPSESLLSWLNSLQSSKVVFMSIKGFTKKYDKDAMTYIIDAALGGVFLMAKKEASLSIQTLIFDTQLKKFIYYESAGAYGEPLKSAFSDKILKESIEDFIKKGANLKLK